MRNVKFAKEVDIKSIARQTAGFSGADLANLVNEAALLAARINKEEVTMIEFQSAIERVIAGPEKKSRVISAYEKQLVAYHESGHALLAFLIPGSEPLHKVSMIPRGLALGYTMRLPMEDRYIMSKKELIGRIIGLLGGRAAEKIVFNEVTTGAANDLDVATEIARHMVCEYGMAEGLGLVTLGRGSHQVFLGRDLFEERNYSEKTAQVVDEEVHKLLNEAYTKAKEVLTEHIDKLKLLATTLIEKEVLEMKEVEDLLGLKPVNV
jgi:cell division protease FtsH